MSHRFILFVWTLALSLAASLAQAVTCSTNMPPASNPDSAYTDNGDGTVTHAPTGLIWKRCAEGQAWNGSTCTGNDSGHTWAEALALAMASNFAGYNDWRLPNVKELRSLVEECRAGPAINDTIFPNTPGSTFWSGSPYVGLSDISLFVSFSFGFGGGNYRSSYYAVRLVRGGQSFDSLGTPSATPTVTSITPTTAYLNVLQQFTITGTNLTAGMGFSVEDCYPSNQEVPNTGSATSRTFQCTPQGTAGVKNATVKTAPGGTVIPIAGAQTTPITIGILPTVTSVTPTTATLGVSTTFTVSGTNLTSGMGFSVEGCNPSNTEVGTGSATQRSFSCVPEFVGTKNVLVKTAPGGTELFRSAAPATPGAVPVVVSDIVVSKALMVALSGAGAMTITSDPAGINCSIANGVVVGTCWKDFNGVTVTLSVNVDNNNSFGGWSGCDSQIADVPPKPPKCVVSTTAAKEVGAVVNATSSGGGGQLCLTLAGNGNMGTIVATNYSLQWNGKNVCIPQFLTSGTTIELTAIVAGGDTFGGWSGGGCYSFKDKCTVTMGNANVNVQAWFDPPVLNQFVAPPQLMSLAKYSKSAFKFFIKSGEVDSAEVQCRPSDGGPIIQPVPFSTENLIVNGFRENITYSCAVRVFNGGVASAWSNSLDLLIGPDLTDTDGDGIPDEWEDKGGVGTILFSEANFGTVVSASKNKKDIFLWIDALEPPKEYAVSTIQDFGKDKYPPLEDKAVRMVQDAFAMHGVNLHVRLNRINKNQMDTAKVSTNPSITEIKQGLLKWKAISFHRNDLDLDRDRVYHYALFGDKFDGDTSGIANLETASLFVAGGASGLSGKGGGLTMAQAGTLMHELGHTLGLGHGGPWYEIGANGKPDVTKPRPGTDLINYKPNYLSVMNYLFQFSGLVVDNGKLALDYASIGYGHIDESSGAFNGTVKNNMRSDPVYGPVMPVEADVAMYGTRIGCDYKGSKPYSEEEIVKNIKNYLPILSEKKCSNLPNRDDINKIYYDVNSDLKSAELLFSYSDWDGLVYDLGLIGAATHNTAGSARSDYSSLYASQASVEETPLTVTESPYAIQVDVGVGARLSVPGKTMKAQFVVRNVGLNVDTYNLAATFDLPWNVAIEGLSEITLLPGASRLILVNLQVPGNASAGFQNRLLLTATSRSAGIIESRQILVTVSDAQTFIDSDGDGLDDTTEIALGTDPNNHDTDGDEIIDSADIHPLTPDTTVVQPLDFGTRTSVPLFTWISSDAVVITGPTIPVSISISNGEYSIDNGAFTANPGTISAGQTVALRVRSASSASTLQTTQLNVSGTTASFTVTTRELGVPTGLTATAVSASQINLAWVASTDDVGVTAYKVYRGGALLATLGNVTTYSNTGLDALTLYSYTVAACDAAGNCSGQSAAVTATTASITAAPVCSLIANPSTITVGSSSTLTATCSPAATSYIWSGGSCAGTSGASCTVKPTATTTYSVQGSNAGGTNQAASATVTVTANIASYTVPGTLGNDVFVLTAGNNYYGGGGNDTFIISHNTLRADVTAKIIDTEGDNLIQLVDGMTVTASSFYSDAAQLTLSNGAKVQILGASKFKFQLGANALAGDAAAVLTYTDFVTSLGASLTSGTLPASGTAGYVVPTGFTQASAPVPSVAGSSYTVSGTLDDDVLVPSGGNSYLGGGGDTYIISPYTLSGAVTAKIIDTEGGNVIQLVGGLTIAASTFYSNAVQFMLSNGAIVQILGASGFSYQLGANAPAGVTASNLSYAQFAAALGASVPTGTSAVSGSVNFVVQSSGQ